MRFYLTYINIMFSLFLYCQTWTNVTTDYINNPSFEDYRSCPQNTSDPFNYWIDSCNYWSHVTYASPDFHHTCQNALLNPLIGVPYNYVMRYQSPYEGNGYLGFYAYALINQNLWCEYVQSPLKKKLDPGKKYKFKMRIIPSKYIGYGVSKIGINISSNSLTNTTQKTSFKLVPTMLNSKGIIADTTKWFLFDEEFTASGFENHITIGWFADTVTSDNGYFDTITKKLDYSAIYYAIDSINIEEITVREFDINIFTPNKDGVNDEIDFSIFNFKNMSFNLYNRWGNLVFSSSNIHLKWDGTSNNNQPLNDGIYYYIISAETTEVKSKIEKKGYLSIIH